jgi:hypothetical protein
MSRLEGISKTRRFVFFVDPLAYTLIPDLSGAGMEEGLHVRIPALSTFRSVRLVVLTFEFFLGG